MLTIAIDAGHGGNDPGATWGQFVEADHNHNMAIVVFNAIKRAYDQVDAFLVRQAIGEGAGLGERGQRTENADFVLSLHTNSHTKTDIHGALTFYWPGNLVAREVCEAISRAMPEPLWRARSSVWCATDNPEPGDDWLQRPRAVLSPHKPDAILLEFGYLSNAMDRDAMLDPFVQRGIVAAIHCGIARLMALKSNACHMPYGSI